MRRRHVVCGLVVVALIGGVSSQVMAQSLGKFLWGLLIASLKRSRPVGC